jgi:hypothetical protein
MNINNEEKNLQFVEMTTIYNLLELNSCLRQQL